VAIQDARDWDTTIKYAVLLKRVGVRTAVGAEGLGDAYETFDLLDKAAAQYRQWATFDPFSADAWRDVVNTDFADARYADAIKDSDQALALHPDDPAVLEYRCVSLANLKRIAEAKADLDILSQSGTFKPLAVHCRFFILLNSEGDKAAIAFVNNVLAHDPQAVGAIGDVGFMLSHTSAVGEAMDYYEKALQSDQFGFGFYPGKSAPEAFLNSPRWIAFTQGPKYQAWATARARAVQQL
jgi:tetratricopeptide (TPR) repeat protein